MANYSGSDLSQEFKDFFQKEKSRISKILKAKKCTQIKMSYGFYYFSGFFTAPSGQVYYFSSSDVRYYIHSRLLIRTAKDYKDYIGGINQYCNIDYKSLMDFKLV